VEKGLVFIKNVSKILGRFKTSSKGFHISMLEDRNPPTTATILDPDWSLRSAQEL
jgi:hypothetical protein